MTGWFAMAFTAVLVYVYEGCESQLRVYRKLLGIMALTMCGVSAGYIFGVS
jgi:hypothetical protein